MTEMHGTVQEQVSFAQQYVLQKGLTKFGQRGSEAVKKELEQLHRRNCFMPMDVSELNNTEKKRAQAALMLLTEKRDGSIKGRCVYNGKPTREWLSKEDASSPTVMTESIMLLATIDAYEGRDVMTADVPNAFIQTRMPEVKEGEDRVIMKITGVLVDLIVNIAPEIYGPFVVMENGKRVLYVQVMMVLYGMLMAALMWYRQFRSDLEEIGFKFNPYEPCVANRVVDSKQHTVRFHVDDLKSSHVNAKVNDDFANWLNNKYGKFGEVKVKRGSVHEYLGMTFDYSTPKTVYVGMIDYVENMIDESTFELNKNDRAPSPANEKLFSVDDKSVPLDKKRAEEYHTIVYKGLFASKRARPDIHTAISFLCTRVKRPTEEDWQKVTRLLKYLNGTRKERLKLTADNINIVKWYVDASFAVHPDFKSHTGACMTLGKGAVQCISRKQKLNTRSSTEAELVGADDASTMILWTKLFLEEQGIEVKQNVLYQDNKSTILLENNGKKSSSKRTRALNIRYFFLTDQIEKGNVEVKYCPTGDMIADYLSKPLQGKLFKKFRDEIMGSEYSESPASSESGRSVLDLPNLPKNSQKIKKKSKKYAVKNRLITH
jgi:Reverse transcriptase (RNA-dependent DNA polymerase)